MCLRSSSLQGDVHPDPTNQPVRLSSPPSNPHPADTAFLPPESQDESFRDCSGRDVAPTRIRAKKPAAAKPHSNADGSPATATADDTMARSDASADGATMPEDGTAPTTTTTMADPAARRQVPVRDEHGRVVMREWEAVQREREDEKAGKKGRWRQVRRKFVEGVQGAEGREAGPQNLFTGQIS